MLKWILDNTLKPKLQQHKHFVYFLNIFHGFCYIGVDHSNVLTQQIDAQNQKLGLSVSINMICRLLSIHKYKGTSYGTRKYQVITLRKIQYIIINYYI